MNMLVGPSLPAFTPGACIDDDNADHPSAKPPAFGSHNGRVFRGPGHGHVGFHAPLNSGKPGLTPRRPPPSKKRPIHSQDLEEEDASTFGLPDAEAMRENALRLTNHEHEEHDGQGQSNQDSPVHQGQRTLDAIFRHAGMREKDDNPRPVAQRFRLPEVKARLSAATPATETLSACGLNGATMLADPARMSRMSMPERRAVFIDFMLAVSTAPLPALAKLGLRLSAMAFMQTYNDPAEQPVTLADVKALLMEATARLAIRGQRTQEGALIPLEILSALRSRSVNATAQANGKLDLIRHTLTRNQGIEPSWP